MTTSRLPPRLPDAARDDPPTVPHRRRGDRRVRVARGDDGRRVGLLFDNAMALHGGAIALVVGVAGFVVMLNPGAKGEE